MERPEAEDAEETLHLEPVEDHLVATEHRIDHSDIIDSASDELISLEEAEASVVSTTNDSLVAFGPANSCGMSDELGGT